MRRGGRFIPARRMPARLPPALRCFAPRLAADQVQDLALLHVDTLDSIVTGQADEVTLWNWIGSILTWSRVAELLERGMDQMTEQLGLATAVLERYGATGSVEFRGMEYQIAKIGVEVMDTLAGFVDRPTAVAAADWSEARLHAMQSEHSARKGCEVPA